MSLSRLSVWSQDEGLHFLVMMDNVTICRKQTNRMLTPRKMLQHSRWTCLIRTGECSSIGMKVIDHSKLQTLKSM